MSRLVRCLAQAVVFAGIVMGACNRAPPADVAADASPPRRVDGPFALGSVTVHVDGNVVDGARFEQLARAELTSTGAFVGVGPDPVEADAWTALSDLGDDRAVEVLLRVQAPAELASQFRDRVVEAHVAWPLRADEPFDEGLTAATHRAAAAIAARLRLAGNEPGIVPRLLHDGDPQLAVIALEWIRAHRDVGEIDTIAALVGHANPEVSALAVEVVGELGSSRHAAALIHHVRLADPGHTHRTYDALARLGGPEAEGFLRFAARNEDEPERQAAARLALDKLMRSTDATRPHPSSLRGHRQ